jgi:glycosyltransferase involved in cell wall biosynthesis
MHFLFISIDGLTDPLGQSQILPYLCGLSELGYQIHVASIEKPEMFEKNQLTIETITKKARITWHYSFYNRNIPIYSQYKNFRALKKLCHSILDNNKKDFILHCRSYLPSLIGLHYKLKKGLPFIFDMRGFWADERVESGTWNLNSAIHRYMYSYFKRKEYEFYNHIVSLTHAAKDEIISKFPEIKKEKISVIPCCADLHLFDYKKYSREINSNNAIVYLGSLGTFYMLDEMLNFYLEYRKVFANAKFRILTPDVNYPLEEILDQKGIPKEEIQLEYAKRSEVPEKIADCRWAIYFIKPSYSKKASSPTKCAELLAMGKPIITNSGIGDSDMIFKDNECGFLIHNFQQSEYLAACNFLYNLSVQPERLYKTAENYFSLKAGVEKYGEIYLALSHD